jgi:hypothetical protein
MMEEALRAALLATSGVQALVSTRIDWGLRPDTLPAIRLQVVSKVPFYTSSGRDGLTPYRVQIDCFGSSYGEAKRVARAVEAAVDAFRRPEFESCFVEAERDDQDTDGADQPVHRTSLDTRIWHHAA